MTPQEIEAALQAAFRRCDAAGFPLSAAQKQILLEILLTNPEPNTANPLDELTERERQAFLQFVRTQELENRSWQVQLLNDWLNNNDSGEVQFIRDRYGLQWVNRITPYHLIQYAELDALQLKVGDQIEVCNSLWEWIPDDDPIQREWFVCTVIQLEQTQNGDIPHTSCTVRFPNGTEYEIQGIYEWNQYNWRFLEA